MDNEVIFATLSPDNLYEKLNDAIRKLLEFDNDANRAAFNLNEDAEPDTAGRNFSQQLEKFMKENAGRAGGEVYSTTLEFTVNYEGDESEEYELIVSKLEGEIQGGGRRRRVRRTRKSRK